MRAARSHCRAADHEVLAALLTVLALAGCTQRVPAPKPLRTSGFLDDYSILRESAPGDVRHVYRNPDAHWASYSRCCSSQ